MAAYLGHHVVGVYQLCGIMQYQYRDRMMASC